MPIGEFLGMAISTFSKEVLKTMAQNQRLEVTLVKNGMAFQGKAEGRAAVRQLSGLVEIIYQSDMIANQISNQIADKVALRIGNNVSGGLRLPNNNYGYFLEGN